MLQVKFAEISEASAWKNYPDHFARLGWKLFILVMPMRTSFDQIEIASPSTNTVNHFFIHSGDTRVPSRLSECQGSYICIPIPLQNSNVKLHLICGLDDNSRKEQE